MAIIKQTAFPSASPPENLSAYDTEVGGGFQGDVTAFTINPSGTLLCSQDSYQNVYGVENPATTDYEAAVDGAVTAAGSGVASVQVGPLVRAYNSAGLYGYYATIRGDGSIAVGKWVAGVRTDLASTSIPAFNAATTYNIRLRATGAGTDVTLTTYLDSAQVAALDWVDSDADRIVAAGNGGIYSRSNNVIRAEAYSLLVQDLAGAAYSLNGGATLVVNVNAGMQYSQPGDVGVSGVLVSATGVALANVSGIHWKWFDTWGAAPTDSGLTSTDGVGAFSLNLSNSIRVAGQTGYLALEHISQGLIGLYKLPVA